MPQKVKLRLFGNTYELKGDETEVDLQDIANFIEAKAVEIEREHPRLPPSKLMVLIAMTLGRELFVTKRQLESLEITMKSKLNRISEKIDAHMLEKKD